MGATRTQIYLSESQRERLDELMEREHKTLAQLVREAVDAYLENRVADPAEALAATFGRIPDLRVPSRDEWDRA